MARPLHRLFAIALCGVALASAAHAQTWPTRAITLIVPYYAGRGPPTSSRARSRRSSPTSAASR